MGKIDEIAQLTARLGGQAPQPKYIRAYHGSPYDFDKFDASKIGAGEGVQAYGHGLYFASQEAVAKQYRDELKGILDKDVPFDLAEESSAAWREWQDALAKEREWDYPNSGFSNLLKELGDANPHSPVARELARKWQDVQRRIESETVNPGRLYEVQIKHPEESLLNWDRPTAPTGGVGARAAEVLRSSSPRAVDIDTLAYIKNMQPGQYSPPAYGSPVHAVDVALRDFAKTPRGAVELSEAGIPGIRYLDGISRPSGGGTRNYVVFPGAEGAIDIIRKWGWMLPALYAGDEVAQDRGPQVR